MRGNVLHDVEFNIGRKSRCHKQSKDNAEKCTFEARLCLASPNVPPLMAASSFRSIETADSIGHLPVCMGI